MSIYNAYNCILNNATEQEAFDYTMGVVWDELETEEQSIAHGRYIGTVNGVEVYYDHGADYYFFCPVEN